MQAGKYYAVNSGYTNRPGFLTPYKGERYHLRDYRGPGRHAIGREELFNYMHYSLRKVMKARFPILKHMPPYSVSRQKYIALACCTVHNFMQKQNKDDELFKEYTNESLILSLVYS